MTVLRLLTPVKRQTTSTFYLTQSYHPRGYIPSDLYNITTKVVTAVVVIAVFDSQNIVRTMCSYYKVATNTLSRTLFEEEYMLQT